MLTKVSKRREAQSIHKAINKNTFINLTNNRTTKNQSKRLLWYEKTSNSDSPAVFKRLSPLLILINVKDTCKTLREIFIQWHIVHW
ncbi:hypothetical protein BCS92_14230 [Vibrio tasmaniensis]|uniref:Uncharacterized protein n=1 Tax=Vibrio tasmaniensis TaxID=212663 RepID=A0A2N7NJP4_9VIBR|nr:hypothetical protein BCS92_14230 [Vibrio tasmaniensis]